MTSEICSVCDEPVKRYEDFVGQWVNWDMSPGTDDYAPEPPTLEITHLDCWNIDGASDLDL